MLRTLTRLANNPMSSCYAIVFFLVVSIFFSLLYYMFVPFIEGNSPLGHNSNQSPRTAVVSFLDCLYFIVTTQKTVGYGDIIPIFVLGNACSIVQGVFGYLYLAFLISILASKAIMESRKIKYTFKVKKLKGQVLLYCKY